MRWQDAAVSVGARAADYFRVSLAVGRRWHSAAVDIGMRAADHLRDSFRAPVAVVGLIALGSSLGGFATTTALLNRGVASPPAEPLPPPKPLWVTDSEVDQQQRLGRQLLTLSPAELMSMYERKGADALETYRDKWIKINYPLTSLGKQTFGKTTYDVVKAAAHFQSAFPGEIVAYFDEQKWDAQLSRRLPKDQVVAFCQFKEIQAEPVLKNINRLWFYGMGCELPQPPQPSPKIAASPAKRLRAVPPSTALADVNEP